MTSPRPDDPLDAAGRRVTDAEPTVDHPQDDPSSVITAADIPGPAATTPVPSPSDDATSSGRRRARLPVATAVLSGAGGIALGVGATLAIVAMTGSSEAEADGGGSVAEVGPSPAEQAMRTAATDCSVSSTDGLELVDDGRTITFDNRGQDDYSGAAYADIACVFEALSLPATIDTHIGQTTSLDGRESAHWQDFEIQWSYHPDRGLDGLMTVVDD